MSGPPSPIGAVIVTYDSAGVVGAAVEALLAGTAVPDPIVVVDNGSADQSYLDDLERRDGVRVVRLGRNLGFCAANNIGAGRLAPGQHVLFLNPDAFVTPDFVEGALARLAGDPAAGAVGPKLLGADATTHRPTGLIDSAGIVQGRGGRFRDRGQGEPDRGQYDAPAEVAALCAAAVVCRRAALAAVAPDGEVFDERFFMYKEDLDLSFRLRKAGWRLAYDPSLSVFHCRGWDRDRRTMPAWTKRRSLANEWRLWVKGVPGRNRAALLPYLVVKSLVVAVGR